MKKIYLDNNSTTPLDPIVLDCMMPFFKEKFGNASSSTHSYGWEASAAIEISRETIANLINANPEQIIFTSGATESNNLSILGAYNKLNKKNTNIITLSTEHKAVLDVCNRVEKKYNNKIIYLNPEKNGIIDINKIINSINDNTFLVSVMLVNNEIGVIQPINKIGKICKEKNIIFHADAAQALGKIPIDVKKMNVDLLSLSGHKIYGPKGIGALYIKNKNLIESQIVGGNQEYNLRSGTLPVPLIVGLGKAAEIYTNNDFVNNETKKILELRNMLVKNILKKHPNTIINGDLKNRIAGNINLTFPFLNGKSIINKMPEIAISSGSACTSSNSTASHVLLNIGHSKLFANSSIRIGIGRFNTIEDIEIASNSILNALKLIT